MDLACPNTARQSATIYAQTREDSTMVDYYRPMRLRNPADTSFRPTPENQLAWLRRNWSLYAIAYVADATEPWSACHITDPDATRRTERTSADLLTWLKRDYEARRVSQLEASGPRVGGWLA